MIAIVGSTIEPKYIMKKKRLTVLWLQNSKKRIKFKNSLSTTNYLKNKTPLSMFLWSGNVHLYKYNIAMSIFLLAIVFLLLYIKFSGIRLLYFACDFETTVFISLVSITQTADQLVSWLVMSLWNI